MLSIVIPSHNCADTLPRTVGSLLSMPFEKELLIIENGSSDQTLSVAEALSREHPEVWVFQSEKGVSKARNTGIEKARGDWIAFADADDEYLPDLANFLRLAEEKKPEIAAAGYRKDADPVRHDYPFLNETLSGEPLDAAKAWMIARPTLRMQAWAKVFRADFLRQNHLYFKENLSYSEDSEFVLRALEKCRSLLISDLLSYGYHSSGSSAMRGFSEGRIEAYRKALREAEKDVAHASPAVRYAFCCYVSAHVNIMAVHDIFAPEIKKGRREKISALKELLQTDVIARNVKKLRVSEFLHLQNLPVMLCRIRFFSLAGWMFTIRARQNQKRFRSAENASAADNKGDRQ